MGGDEARDTAGPGSADLFEGEKRGSWDKLVVAQSAEEGDVSLVEDKPSSEPTPSW